MNQRRFETLLARTRLSGGPQADDRYWRLVLELEEWADQLGLSNLRDREEIAVRHVLDALLMIRVVAPPGRLIDVGTGPGVPALPLAIAWPECEVIALDSRRKSNWFVERTAKQLGLANVAHVCARAESAVVSVDLAGSADLVCSRGLAKPRRAIELTSPFRAAEGVVVTMTGAEAEELELLEGESVVIEALGTHEWQRWFILSHGRPPHERTSGGAPS